MIFTEFLRFFYPSWRSGTKSTYGLPFWEKSGKCRVQVNPRDPNFGQFWSTPGTQNWPKSGSDLMGHYQGASVDFVALNLARAQLQFFFIKKIDIYIGTVHKYKIIHCKQPR